MPNVKWETREPKYLAAAKAEGVVDDLVVRLLDYLKGLPQGVQKVSTMVTKKALGLDQTAATKKNFTRAMDLLTEHGEHGWDLQGRSLVRISFEILFEGTTK